VAVDTVVTPASGRDQPVEQVEDVDTDVRIVVLVDDDRGGGVRDVDGDLSLVDAGAREQLSHPRRQVDHLALLSRSEPQPGDHRCWSSCWWCRAARRPTR